MRPFAAIAILAAFLLAGCDVTHRVAGAINPDSMGLADRCGEIMRMAMPFAEIEIKNRTSENSGVDLLTARVEGVRSDLPKDSPLPREVAAECQFDNQTLIGFRWTRGGPTPPGVPPQEPAKP
jgi:hypothetical protein